MNWKLLPWTCASMSFHMALDEILFRQREEAYRQEEPAVRDTIYQKLPPLLRFYFADKPSVTIGYSHRDIKAADSGVACHSEANGRRISKQRSFAASLLRMTNGKGETNVNAVLPVIQRITGGATVTARNDDYRTR